MFTAASSASVTLIPFSYSPGSRRAYTFRPVLVVVAPIRSMITSSVSNGRPRQFRLTKLNMRCSILFHFDVPGGKWQTRIEIASSLGELLQFGLPQVGAAGVAAAALSSDRQARRFGVALLAEVLPPRADRVDREGAGVVGDPDRHHPLVGFDVKHAVRDRVPQILVLEV